MQTPDYLTVRQVADRFVKSPSWVVRRIKDGRLPAANVSVEASARMHALVELSAWVRQAQATIQVQVTL